MNLLQQQLFLFMQPRIMGNFHLSDVFQSGSTQSELRTMTGFLLPLHENHLILVFFAVAETLTSETLSLLTLVLMEVEFLLCGTHLNLLHETDLLFVLVLLYYTDSK